MFLSPFTPVTFSTFDLCVPSISSSTGGLPLAAFNLGKVRPYQRGFFCKDDSIKYPFHPSTVTSTVLYTVGFSLPISCVSKSHSGTSGKHFDLPNTGGACRRFFDGVPRASKRACWSARRQEERLLSLLPAVPLLVLRRPVKMFAASWRAQLISRAEHIHKVLLPSCWIRIL